MVAVALKKKKKIKIKIKKKKKQKRKRVDDIIIKGTRYGRTRSRQLRSSVQFMYMYVTSGREYMSLLECIKLY